MKRSLLAVAVGLVLPAAAAAQDFPAGKWTGSVTPPGEMTVPVTYDVAVASDSITIMLHAGEHGSFPTQNVKLAEGQLTFSFTPGPTVDCALTRREDGSWAGQCTEGGGSPADIVMTPPKKDG